MGRADVTEFGGCFAATYCHAQTMSLNGRPAPRPPITTPSLDTLNLVDSCFPLYHFVIWSAHITIVPHTGRHWVHFVYTSLGSVDVHAASGSRSLGWEFMLFRFFLDFISFYTLPLQWNRSSRALNIRNTPCLALLLVLVPEVAQAEVGCLWDISIRLLTTHWKTYSLHGCSLSLRLQWNYSNYTIFSLFVYPLDLYSRLKGCYLAVHDSAGPFVCI